MNLLVLAFLFSSTLYAQVSSKPLKVQVSGGSGTQNLPAKNTATNAGAGHFNFESDNKDVDLIMTLDYIKGQHFVRMGTGIDVPVRVATPVSSDNGELELRIIPLSGRMDSFKGTRIVKRALFTPAFEASLAVRGTQNPTRVRLRVGGAFGITGAGVNDSTSTFTGANIGLDVRTELVRLSKRHRIGAGMSVDIYENLLSDFGSSMQATMQVNWIGKYGDADFFIGPEIDAAIFDNKFVPGSSDNSEVGIYGGAKAGVVW